MCSFFASALGLGKRYSHHSCSWLRKRSPMCWKCSGERECGTAPRQLSSDFSKQVLSVGAARLLVLRVRDLGWSDLGHPERGP
jgi:hypothetical protein